MVIKETSQQDAYILEGSGRMDFKARRVFQNAIKTGLNSEATHIVFNLSEISFLDSAGLALIVLAKRGCEEHGVKFSICQPQKSVQDVLELTNMSKHISIFGSIQHALSHQHHSILQ